MANDPIVGMSSGSPTENNPPEPLSNETPITLLEKQVADTVAQMKKFEDETKSDIKTLQAQSKATLDNASLVTKTATELVEKTKKIDTDMANMMTLLIIGFKVLIVMVATLLVIVAGMVIGYLAQNLQSNSSIMDKIDTIQVQLNSRHR